MRLTFRKLGILILIIYLLFTCYTSYTLLSRKWRSFFRGARVFLQNSSETHFKEKYLDSRFGPKPLALPRPEPKARESQIRQKLGGGNSQRSAPPRPLLLLHQRDGRRNLGQSGHRTFSLGARIERDFGRAFGRNLVLRRQENWPIQIPVPDGRRSRAGKSPARRQQSRSRAQRSGSRKTTICSNVVRFRSRSRSQWRQKR